MVKLGRKGRYKTAEYKAYAWELLPGMKALPKRMDEVPTFVRLTFNVKGGVQLPHWKVIAKDTGNTWRNCDTLQEAQDLAKDKHRIEYVEAKIMYGSVADGDNLTKAILDILEDRQRIPNDRYVRMSEIQFTFNNPQNSIDIEIENLETEADDRNIYRLKRRP